MKHTTISNKNIFIILVTIIMVFVSSCSWEIFDPLNKPTSTFSGEYNFEDSWWEEKWTIETYFDERGNEIFGLWMEKVTTPASPVLIYFHGIGGNLGTYAAHIRYLYENSPFSVFAIDYPASGMSRGNRSEEDLYASARGALNWVVNETALSHDQIVVYGFSLGAALSIKLGSENPTLPVVSDGAFTSYGDWMPTVSYINFVLPGENKFDNLSHIKQVQGPKLFIHGTDDRQNPYWMSEALYEAAGDNKEFVTLQGAGHMFSSQYASDNSTFYDQIMDELERLVSVP